MERQRPGGRQLADGRAGAGVGVGVCVDGWAWSEGERLEEVMVGVRPSADGAPALTLSFRPARSLAPTAPMTRNCQLVVCLPVHFALGRTGHA